MGLLGLLLRDHATPGRRWAAAGVGAVLVLLAVAIRVGEGGPRDARDLATSVGLFLLVPVVTVVFATAVLGDPADDGTIGYLLTTPTPRWRIVLAAYGATVLVVLPATLVPIGVALALNGVGTGELVDVLGATAAGSAAYAALFLALGIRLRRALVVGLVYSALWENVVAGFGVALGRVSIREYVLSLLAALEGRPVPEAGVSGTAAGVVLTVVVVVGLGVATLLLRGHRVRV